MKIGDFSEIHGEISGAIADLGTFLPYVLGAIIIGGLDASSIFITFGLMYIFTGYFYRIPIPVQPMKIIGAAILVHHLTAGEVAAAGIMMGLTLFILAITGLASRLAGLTPDSVTLGIQAGLGVSLAMLGIKYIKTDLLLGLIIMLFMLFLFQNRRFPASIAGVVGGTLLAFVLHPEIHWPSLQLGFYWPQLILPAWTDFARGFTLAYLPQLPLTLTNSVLVTAILAHELFPEQSEKVNEKNLCLTLGIGNLLAAPLGGFAMCHGSGGLAAHYRFGGRTGFTPALMGIILLFTGIFLGPAGVDLLQIIPQAVLGGLLFFSGVDLVRGVQDFGDKKTLFCFAVVLIISIAVNPAIAFVVGLILHFLFNKGWVKI